MNKSLWQSLKARDAIMHPSLEQPESAEQPMSYDEYASERKKALKKPE